MDILKKSRSIAVVGLSSKPYRPSFEVAKHLLEAGYTIVPVNPLEREVHGLKAYASLEDVPGEIDIVDVFRRSEEVAPVAEAAIRKGAKVLWLQQGIVNEAAGAKAQAAGLTVVMDACMLIEHRRHRAQLER
ncbi:MAG TPA: CoA-binding protein [Candidatus Acidoferrales bacterium]|nr:CoA-binding protein [Candidatus Acidoferrales bacterium]